MYILGDVFMRNYLAVFNVEKKKLAIGLPIGSTSNITFKLPGWAILLIIIGALILVIGIALAVYSFSNRRRKGDISSAYEETLDMDEVR